MCNRALKTVRFKLLSICVFLPVLLLGCSVFMAANQPEKKNLDVLEKGTPRDAVISELGRPTFTDDDPEGHYCHETYAFEQGYSGLTKGGRATFHLLADVFTLGLWEIVGTPTELVLDGTEVDLEVLYDENDRVESVCVVSGAGVVESDAIVSPATLRQQLNDAREKSRADADATPSTRERLLELERLFESNLITEEDYQKKRKEILEELHSPTP
jgi:hypothetical protein